MPGGHPYLARLVGWGPCQFPIHTMSGAGFKPDSILTQAKDNNAAGIRALVDAGVPVEFCNQVRSVIVGRAIEGRRTPMRPSGGRQRATPTDPALPLPPACTLHHLQIGQTALHVAALW